MTCGGLDQPGNTSKVRLILRACLVRQLGLYYVSDIDD
ncbi:Hypothetical protein Cul210931_1188 [Corynebacterium ulcerans]|nr:Hypothetical protein Cul210931_1188 [Corynebacterium ulcerans]